MSCSGCSYSGSASSCNSLSYSHNTDSGVVVEYSTPSHYKSSVQGNEYSALPVGLDYQISKNLKEIEEKESPVAPAPKITEVLQPDNQAVKIINPTQEIVDNQVIQHQNEIMQNGFFSPEVIKPKQEIMENHGFPAKTARIVEVEEQILIKRRKRVVEF